MPTGYLVKQNNNFLSWSLLLLGGTNSRLTWWAELLLKGPQNLCGIHVHIHFRGCFSLCVAILTKLNRKITHHNFVSVSLTKHYFNNLSNLSRLILRRGGFYTNVEQPQKMIFSTEKSILGWKSVSGKAAFQSILKF